MHNNEVIFSAHHLGVKGESSLTLIKDIASFQMRVTIQAARPMYFPQALLMALFHWSASSLLPFYGPSIICGDLKWNENCTLSLWGSNHTNVLRVLWFLLSEHKSEQDLLPSTEDRWGSWHSQTADFSDLLKGKPYVDGLEFMKHLQMFLNNSEQHISRISTAPFFWS